MHFYWLFLLWQVKLSAVKHTRYILLHMYSHTHVFRYMFWFEELMFYRGFPQGEQGMNSKYANCWHMKQIPFNNYFFVCFGHEFTCFICVNTPVLWLSLELQWVGRWKATDSNGGCCSWHCDTHLSRKISGNRSCEPWYRVRVRWLVLLLQTSSSTASQDFCFKPSPQLRQFGLMWYNCNASDGLGLLFFFFLIKYV